MNEMKKQLKKENELAVAETKKKKWVRPFTFWFDISLSTGFCIISAFTLCAYLLTTSTFLCYHAITAKT